MHTESWPLPRPVENHAWVEVTHCAQLGDITEATEAKCSQLRTEARNGTRRPIKNGRLAFQCMRIAGQRGSWAWRFGTMWFYVAPGSGVSVNVGRSQTFSDYAAAIKFLGLAMRAEPLLRNGHGGVYAADVNESRGLANQLDSIQILTHDEYFSTEPRYELVLLRHAECERLDQLPSRIMKCGRHPHLEPCATGSPALRRVVTCKHGSSSIHKSVHRHMIGCKKATLRAQCLRNGSRYVCTT